MHSTLRIQNLALASIRTLLQIRSEVLPNGDGATIVSDDSVQAVVLNANLTEKAFGASDSTTDFVSAHG